MYNTRCTNFFLIVSSFGIYTERCIPQHLKYTLALPVRVAEYCMHKKTCPRLYSESLCKNGQEFLDTRYDRYRSIIFSLSCSSCSSLVLKLWQHRQQWKSRQSFGPLILILSISCIINLEATNLLMPFKFFLETKSFSTFGAFESQIS